MRPTDLHRPYIDELTRPNPDDPTGTSTMRRVPEVFDCWFEIGLDALRPGALSPSRTRNGLKNHFPADFIVEYINQTRGWFYTLHVLVNRAVLIDPPFQNAIAHGVVWPRTATSCRTAQELSRSPRDARDRRRRRASLVHAWLRRSFEEATYASAERDIRDVTSIDHAAPSGTPIPSSRLLRQRRWPTCGVRLTSSDRPCRSLHLGQDTRTRRVGRPTPWTRTTCPVLPPRHNRFTDALNNWYIRRSRSRFWAPNVGKPTLATKQAAYNTLYTVLVTLSRTFGASPAHGDRPRSIAASTGRRQTCTSLIGPLLTSLPSDPETGCGYGTGVREVCFSHAQPSRG